MQGEVHAFILGIFHRLTEGVDSEGHQSACHALARHLVAQDPTLSSRLHHTLALDRIGIDPDDQEYVVANGLAVVAVETLHVLRQLDANGGGDAADALDRVVINWSAT